MPFVSVETNLAIDTEKRKQFCKALSSAAAQAVGKPEQYVMALIRSDATLTFGGSEEPAAFVELKSIALAEAALKEISRRLCTLIEQELGVPPARIYIEFTSASGAWWGWNGSTF
jgi:phenylpyruvate tautomerase PptA (4-oxalocrotonate tautomerase family)